MDSNQFFPMKPSEFKISYLVESYDKKWLKIVEVDMVKPSGFEIYHSFIKNFQELTKYNDAEKPTVSVQERHGWVGSDRIGTGQL